MSNDKQALYDEIKSIAAEMATLVHDPELTAAFTKELPDMLDYNSGQIMALHDASTPTLKTYAFGSWDAKSSREDRQAHLAQKLLHKAFVDPIIKTSQNISGGVTIERDDIVLKHLDYARKCISDIQHNYFKILPHNMPQKISRTLTAYSDLSIRMGSAFAELNKYQKPPYEADPKKHHTSGMDHLNRVSDDFFMIPEATAEASPELHKELLDIATKAQTIAEDLKIIDLEYRDELMKHTQAAREQRLAGEKITAAPPKLPVLVEALESLFEQIEFSPEQMQALENAYSISLTQKAKRDSTANILAHSCLDPFKKVINAITENINLETYASLPEYLDAAVRCLDDITNNCQKMFSGYTVPEIVKNAIEGYEEILEMFEEAYEMADAGIDVPYTLAPIKKHDNGKEHLNALPENFVELGFKPPEPTGLR